MGADSLSSTTTARQDAVGSQSSPQNSHEVRAGVYVHKQGHGSVPYLEGDHDSRILICVIPSLRAVQRGCSLLQLGHPLLIHLRCKGLLRFPLALHMGMLSITGLGILAATGRR